MTGNPHTRKRWATLFFDLIIAGWSAAEIMEGYGLSPSDFYGVIADAN